MAERQVHDYYIYHRAIFMSLLSAAFVLFAAQIYRDRSALRSRSWKSLLHTRRVLRFGGFTMSFIGVIIMVDYTGAFGIYGPATIVFLSVVLMAIWSIVFAFYTYRSYVAASPYIHKSERPHPWAPHVFITFFTSTTFATILAYTVLDRTFQVAVSVVQSVQLVIIGLAILVAYVLLRRQQKFLSRSTIKPTDRNTKSHGHGLLLKMMNRWRKFTVVIIILNTILTTTFLSKVYHNVINIDSPPMTLRQYHIVADPSRPPPGFPLDMWTLYVALMTGVIFMFLWYGKVRHNWSGGDTDEVQLVASTTTGTCTDTARGSMSKSKSTSNTRSTMSRMSMISGRSRGLSTSSHRRGASMTKSASSGYSVTKSLRVSMTKSESMTKSAYSGYSPVSPLAPSTSARRGHGRSQSIPVNGSALSNGYHNRSKSSEVFRPPEGIPEALEFSITAIEQPLPILEQELTSPSCDLTPEPSLEPNVSIDVSHLREHDLGVSLPDEDETTTIRNVTVELGEDIVDDSNTSADEPHSDETSRPNRTTPSRGTCDLETIEVISAS